MSITKENKHTVYNGMNKVSIEAYHNPFSRDCHIMKNEWVQAYNVFFLLNNFHTGKMVMMNQARCLKWPILIADSPKTHLSINRRVRGELVSSCLAAAKKSMAARFILKTNLVIALLTAAAKSSYFSFQIPKRPGLQKRRARASCNGWNTRDVTHAFYRSQWAASCSIRI